MYSDINLFKRIQIMLSKFKQYIQKYLFVLMFQKYKDYKIDKIWEITVIFKMFKTHKRNISQSLKPYCKQSQNKRTNLGIQPGMSRIVPKTGKQRTIKPTQKTIKTNNHPKSRIYQLVQQSSEKIAHRKLLVQQLQSNDNTETQYQDDDENNSSFFNFGRKKSAPHSKSQHHDYIHSNENMSKINKWELDIDRITQAQQSNTKRQITSYRSCKQQTHSINKPADIANKENIQHCNNSINNTKYKHKYKSKSKSKSSKNNSNVINEKSKKTQKKHKDSITDKASQNKSVSQSHKNSNSKNRKGQHHKSHSHNIQLNNNAHAQMGHRTQKLEKSMKMLWQCMGQLWQNTRVSHYKSQKNSESITGIRRMIDQQQKKILDMKFELHKIQNGQKVGLRH